MSGANEVLLTLACLLALALVYAFIFWRYERDMHKLYKSSYLDLIESNKETSRLFDEAMAGWRHANQSVRELLHDR